MSRDRRREVRDDLADLFRERRAARGLVHASWRLAIDVASLLRPGVHLGHLLRDVRFGARLFRQRPLALLLALAGLAVAIAVNTAVFGVLDAVVFRSPGMDDAESLYRVRRVHQGGNSTTWSYAEFRALADRVGDRRGFRDPRGPRDLGSPSDVGDQGDQSDLRLDAYSRDAARIGVSADASPAAAVEVAFVSGGLMASVGGHPALGRTLVTTDDQPGAPPVLFVSHAYWTSALVADPAIVGRTLWVSGAPMTVVGVARRGFDGPTETPPALWMPIGARAQVYASAPVDRQSQFGVNLLLRRPAGAAVDVIASRLGALAAAMPVGTGLNADGSPVQAATGVSLASAASRVDPEDAREVYAVVGVIFVLVGLVLALACANVANVLLANAAARAREIGVRRALGASRGRIVAQLMSESVVLGLAAGFAALLCTRAIGPFLAPLLGLPPTLDVQPNLRVYGVATLLGLLGGLGAGLAPARFGANGQLAGAIARHTGAAPGASRLRRWLVGFQAAASALLFITAALFTREALHVARVDVGFDAEHVLSLAPELPADITPDAARAYWASAGAAAARVPGVIGTAVAQYTPFGGRVEVAEIVRGGVTYQAYLNRVDARFVGAVGMRVSRGRALSEDDVRAAAPVALISESLAREFMPGADPIGRPLAEITGRPDPEVIIGVVADAVTARMHAEHTGTIYLPLTDAAVGSARLMIRADNPAAIAARVEAAVHAAEPRVPVRASLMRDAVAAYRAEPRIPATVTAVVGALAVVLALVGLYGVTTFVVGQRAPEIAVRMALGASSASVRRLLVWQSLRPVAAGLALGAIAAFAASPIFSAGLTGTDPRDPVSFLAPVALLLATACLAVLPPARRAARANPVEALRNS